ncbi:MAG TPA: glutathione S-transferase family protein [Rhizobiales bacterium]|nr:putative GST-like protein YibF [bacterium BMS3Bbin10]HDO52448.1 glutathione S-transferase family protein [Hyphomicrobiales bacterium]
MILTGQLDSPFVRRVAIALHVYELPFEHNVISAYDDFDELLALNPLGKVPALQLDDGSVLADSTLILDYLDRIAGAEKALLPGDAAARAGPLAHMGVAAGLAEKAVEFRTETVRRPRGKIDGPRVNRILAQIAAALRWLEAHTPEEGFISGGEITHADIASAVTVTFIANRNGEHLAARGNETEQGFAKLIAHARRCEMMAAFESAPFMQG